MQIRVEGLRITSELASSEFLRGLQSISGTDLTGGDVRARQLGLARSYAVYVYTVCSRPFDGGESCSEFEVGWWFNPQKTLRLRDRGLRVQFPNSYESAIDFYRQTSYYLGIGIILALSATALAFVFGGLARRYPRLRVVPVIVSLIAAALIAAEASLAFRVSQRMTKALSSGLDIGITASIGPMVYMLFATMGVSFLAFVVHFFAMARGKQATYGKKPRYPRFAGPPDDPAAGQYSGYDNKRSLKQMLSWKNHKYEKVGDPAGQQKAISMEPLRPQDEASLLRPDEERE